MYLFLCFFFFKQKTAYEIGVRLVGSEMCIRDRSTGDGQRISVCQDGIVHEKGGIRTHGQPAPRRLIPTTIARRDTVDLSSQAGFTYPHRLLHGEFVKEVEYITVLHFRLRAAVRHPDFDFQVRHLLDQDRYLQRHASSSRPRLDTPVSARHLLAHEVQQDLMRATSVEQKAGIPEIALRAVFL